MNISSDYLESLVTSRQDFIDEVRVAGGIDFNQLCESPYDAHGGMVNFRLLGGLTFRGMNLGFKQFKSTARWELDGFAEEVATLRHIGKQSLRYRDMLPRVHYEVRGEDDSPLGIITEDFTQGGRKRNVAEIALWGLDAMFSDPSVIDEDNARGMLGVFQDEGATGLDGRADHIIDVTPLYATHRFDTPFGMLPERLVEEIELPKVTSKLSELRINTEELIA